jgi:hypothetical protein
MFVNELRKQKVLFASVDAVALVLAAWGALAIHDPSRAMRDKLLANPAAMVLDGSAVVACWILIFRWLDLYRMRGGGRTEAPAVCRGNVFGALLAIIAGFLMHQDVSRITTLLTYALAVISVLTACRAPDRTGPGHSPASSGRTPVRTAACSTMACKFCGAATPRSFNRF